MSDNGNGIRRNVSFGSTDARPRYNSLGNDNDGVRTMRKATSAGSVNKVGTASPMRRNTSGTPGKDCGDKKRYIHTV
jgi:hypothetical protein